MSKKIGLIAHFRVDDTHRKDIADMIKANMELAEDVKVELIGSLDGMTDDEIKGLSFEPEQGLSWSYKELLTDGTIAYIKVEELRRLIREKAEKLAEMGAVCSLVVCTCSDHEKAMGAPNLLTPSKWMETATLQLLPEGGTIGVINPDPSSVDYEFQKWKLVATQHGVSVINDCAFGMPEGTSEWELASEEERASAADAPVEVAKKLVAKGADVIVMDCAGYDVSFRDRIAAETGKPVIHPLSLMGKIISSVYNL